MFHHQLTYAQLAIEPEDVFRQMGYGDARPDAAVAQELRMLMDTVAPLAQPRFCFTVKRGTLTADTLTIDGTCFHTGPIISRQLRGAEAFALFLCTAGSEIEDYSRRMTAGGDMLRAFMADALGSVMAERCADAMERSLQESIDKLSWHRTNRFSPGYCRWHVSGQHALFPFFGSPNACNVTLNESALMTPIKSVSGVIGLGSHVRRLDYSCGLCDMKDCFKRRGRR